MAQLKNSTVRDFSGGLNLTDNPYNLSSKYQTVSDNVVVGPDGALSPRQGYKFFQRLKGVNYPQYTVAPPSGLVNITFTNNNPGIVINWNAHGLATDDVIEFQLQQTYNPATGHILEGRYVVQVQSANQFFVWNRTNASATTVYTTFPAGYSSIRSSRNLLPGNPIDMAFFQGNVLVFDDLGCIASISSSGNAALIWSPQRSSLLPGAPVGWRSRANYLPLNQVSFDTFKQTMIVVNGRDNDKPIEINFNKSPLVQFVVDPATVSNSNVYAADLVQAFDGYVLLHSSNNTATPTSNTITTVDISAKNTSGVFVGNASPADAVQIDLGRVSQTVDPRITAVSNIRNKLFIAFPDSAMLGTLGIYSGAVHEPDFSDQIPQHGALNQRVIQNVGNDLFMCDYSGVPAFSQSQQSNSIVPERLSQLIDPALNAHLSRLSAYTLRYRIWSLFNIRDRMYMLFMPKYDESSVKSAAGEFLYVATDFRLESTVVIRIYDHGFSAGDILGITTVGFACAGLASVAVNGAREVVAVIDKDTFLMKVGAIPTVDGATGTVTSMYATPQNDETICYAFQYNPALRIRRWTKLRGWKFVAGTLSNDGRVFVIDEGGLVWQLGTVDRPVYSDKQGFYQYSWLNSTAYTVGMLIKQPDSDQVFKCLVAHTSPASGSFPTDRIANPLRWEPAAATPIYWAAETPWSDMGDRTAVKVGEHILFDITGEDKFDFSLFVDNIVDDKATYKKSPTAEAVISAIPNVVGNDAGGFGSGPQNYGTGRRAREQLLYHFPFRAKLAKMRFQGATTKQLRIISATISYKSGSIYR